MCSQFSDSHGSENDPPAPIRDVSLELLGKLCAGEISALDDIFCIYGDRVFRVCLGILGNEADAEDATQEVFLRVYQQARKFRGRSRFSTWLLRLAANHTLNMVHKRNLLARQSGPIENDLVSPAPTPESGALDQEQRAKLCRLLQELSFPQRQVLVLRELEGLNYRELAEILGVPEGTVTSRLNRARASLQALAKKAGINFADFG